MRASLVPGTVLILLAGRFRGKRVVYLKHLEDNTLLVSGPFKVNGVPLRRVNSRYVIATSTTVAVSSVNVEKFNVEYFAREKLNKKEKKEANLFPENTTKEVNEGQVQLEIEREKQIESYEGEEQEREQLTETPEEEDNNNNNLELSTMADNIREDEFDDDTPDLMEDPLIPHSMQDEEDQDVVNESVQEEREAEADNVYIHHDDNDDTPVYDMSPAEEEQEEKEERADSSHIQEDIAQDEGPDEQ